MKRGLLKRYPSVSDLNRLYFELAARGAPAVGKRCPWPYRVKTDEEILALAAEMLRYDARLLTILVQWISRSWTTMNPLAIRMNMTKAASPQSLCVVCEFVEAAYADNELRYFCDYLRAGWPRQEPMELFFLDTPAPGGRVAQRKLGRNLRQYAVWGFIGTERPTVDQETRRVVGGYSPQARRSIVREHMQAHSAARLGELMEMLDHTISRQQLLADLKSIGAVSRGHGRGARWTLKR